MIDLRDRCQKMYQKMRYDAMMRRGSPVDDLMAFVISETGRASEHRFEKRFPLCLFFNDEQSRDEFIALWREDRPNVTIRKIP
jgi:hypothetical protein